MQILSKHMIRGYSRNVYLKPSVQRLPANYWLLVRMHRCLLWSGCEWQLWLFLEDLTQFTFLLCHTRFWIMFTTVCQCHLCCALESNVVSSDICQTCSTIFHSIKHFEGSWMHVDSTRNIGRISFCFVVKQFVFLTTVQRMPDMSAQLFLSKTLSQMWNNSRTLTLAAENFRYVDILHLLTFFFK